MEDFSEALPSRTLNVKTVDFRSVIFSNLGPALVLILIIVELRVCHRVSCVCCLCTHSSQAAVSLEHRGLTFDISSVLKSTPIYTKLLVTYVISYVTLLWEPDLVGA